MMPASRLRPRLSTIVSLKVDRLSGDVDAIADCDRGPVVRTAEGLACGASTLRRWLHIHRAIADDTDYHATIDDGGVPLQCELPSARRTTLRSFVSIDHCYHHSQPGFGGKLHPHAEIKALSYLLEAGRCAAIERRVPRRVCPAEILRAQRSVQDAGQGIESGTRVTFAVRCSAPARDDLQQMCGHPLDLPRFQESGPAEPSASDDAALLEGAVQFVKGVAIGATSEKHERGQGKKRSDVNVGHEGSPGGG